MSKLTVKKEPCLTCPYRKDVPSGVWSREEYEKLRRYDEGYCEIPELATFLCHQSSVAGIAIACKGWLIVHQDSVAVRLAILRKEIDPQTAFEEPSCELYASGNEAADAGERDVEKPKRKALKVVEKLKRTGQFKTGDQP